MTIFNSSAELKAAHNEHFVRLAYSTILGREVDSEGLSNFTAHIREDLSPAEIIAELYNSPEGQLCRKNFLVPYEVVQQANNLTKRTLYYYVDHTIQCPINSGVQRVVRRFAKALLDIGENVRFVKWCSQTNQLILINKNELQHLGQWNGPAITEAILNSYPDPNQSSVKICLNAANGGDWLIIPEVPHITFQAHPMTLQIISKGKQLGLKLAFIFYDAIPLRRNELKHMSSVHVEYMQQLLLADLIVPISNYSSADLVSFFKFHECTKFSPTPQIYPIPLPGESHLAEKTINVSSERTSTTILSVGSIVPHKNQLMLVRAFDQYCKTNPNTNWKLKLIGNLHPELADEIRGTTNINKQIEYLGDVSDNDLEGYYRACSFTIFPSILEGFGLPILESLWFAKPCICANFGAMAEVASGGGCVTVDTNDTSQLYQAITMLIEKPEKIYQLSKEAANRLIPSWIDYAKEFSFTLDKVSDPLQSLGNIYYWIDHTSIYPSNSGIQRVVRGLARALLEQGVSLIPTKWDEDKQCFYPASTDELNHLAKWNGPAAHKWSEWINPLFASPKDWILVPELTHYLVKTSVNDILAYSKNIGVRCSWIFYDAIPWKMLNHYPPEATEAHKNYMLGLNSVQKVFSISEFTRKDLFLFITTQDVRVGNMENRLVNCALPGEFLGTKQIQSVNETINTDKVKILCVCTVEPRKNHIGLLKAFLEAQRKSSIQIELTIVGGEPFTNLAAEVDKIIAESNGITWEKKADDKALLNFYNECDFSIFPSLEEGFGLPILESLWNARPCICANFGAMAEVAEGGGCLTVDVRNTKMLADAIIMLAENKSLLKKLSYEAINRKFKTWHEYGHEIALELATERYINTESELTGSCSDIKQLHEVMINLEKRPLLSICISTYNRAGWLALSLKNLEKLLPTPSAEIEIVVVDNTSTDATQEVAQAFSHRRDFHYFRNPENVGMLGNLRVTANHAKGNYIWILGDDDLVKPGGIERIITAIKANPEVALVYLNYAYTRIDDSNEVESLEQFLTESTPIVAPCPDVLGSVRQMCTQSENFFTAIYCLVFRRDHAIRAYSQNTDGRPFSTMLTCIPTTYYVLNYMMDESAYWIGEPQLVVNLNVSWMKYAPLWILERIPEVYDTAEKLGADPILIDRWRVNNMPGVLHFFKEIFDNDPENNAEYVSIVRLINRLKHLQEFKEIVPHLKEVYENAYSKNHPLAQLSSVEVFAAF